MLNHFSKQLKMRSDKLRDIYHEKSKWANEMLKHQQSSAKDYRKNRSGLSKGKKVSGGNKLRLRASRGGAKRQFPHLYDEVKDWLEKERSHGHGVQKMDLAWRYYKLLSDEKNRLEKQRDELDEGPERILCMNQLARAASQMKSIGEGYKQRERLAKRIMDAIGAKHLTPNHCPMRSSRLEQNWHGSIMTI